jgi:exosortase
LSAALKPPAIHRQTGQFTVRKPAFSWSHLFVLGLWSWAIWACAEHWRGNPNYSYGWAVPFLVAGFALRRYLLFDGVAGPTAGPALPLSVQISAGIAAFALVALLEFSRELVWHQEIVLWLICLFTVGATFVVFRFYRGLGFARTELFPVLFFFTAVPWPPRIEQPIVSNLMRWVATATTELLHWLGVEAQTSGGAIALRTGLVGISEACSGVRSLQAGIMFGLAMGEWFLLRPSRRIVLLLLAIGLALITNLIRTLLLALQAEHHGVDSVERVHDVIGNVTITALVVAIWIAGKILAPRYRQSPSILIDRFRGRFRDFVVSWSSPAGQSLFRPITAAFLFGIVSAHALAVWTEGRDTQTTPLFAARIDPANHLHPISSEVWHELRPTSGEQVRRRSADLPGGVADCFHFFWKPSPWNRFALVHRPDICMPGVGWSSVAAPEPIAVSVDGQSLSCHLFRFRRGNVYALELWGVWRNGEPVPLNYTPDQVLGTLASASSLQLEGKKRSATEIIACSVIADDKAPPAEIAVALLQSVFEYKRHE